MELKVYLIWNIDDKRLLSFVPQKYRKKAQALLQHFNARGNELTYDSSGIIYIDSVAIPNSDIFVYFPYLFKAKRRKDLNGFEDFVKKIVDMGLNDLIFQKEINYQIEKSVKGLEEKDFKDSNHRDINWWFID